MNYGDRLMAGTRIVQNRIYYRPKSAVFIYNFVKQGLPFFFNGPQPLIWAGLRAEGVKITKCRM